MKPYDSIKRYIDETLGIESNYARRIGPILLFLGLGVFVYTMNYAPRLDVWGCLKAAHGVMGIVNTVILFIFMLVGGLPIYLAFLLSVVVGIPSVGIIIIYYLYFVIEDFHNRKG